MENGNKKEIAESSKKLYLRALDKIKQLGIDIDNIDINNINILIKNNNYTKSKISTLFDALLWYSRDNNKNIDKIEQLLKIVRDFIKIKTNNYMNNELSETEKEKFVSWDIILKIYDKLKLFVNETKNLEAMLDFAILSMYILLPPRRIQEYSLMILKMNVDMENIDKNTILWTDGKDNDNYDYDYDAVKNRNNNKDYNEYIINKDNSFFVYNKYKTHKFYGTVIIQVPTNLNEILKNYIKNHNIDNNKSLFNLQDLNFVIRVESIFFKYIKKKISVNTLRHIYISYFLETPKITIKKKIYNGAFHGA